jgi:hypothetical protein
MKSQSQALFLVITAGPSPKPTSPHFTSNFDTGSHSVYCSPESLTPGEFPFVHGESADGIISDLTQRNRGKVRDITSGSFLLSNDERS